MTLLRPLGDPWTATPGAVAGAAAWTVGVRPLAAVCVAVAVVAARIAAARLGGGRRAALTTAGFDGYVFRRDGQFWRVGSGQAVFALHDVKGLRCLHVLVGHPNQAFHCLELAQLCEVVRVSRRRGRRPAGTGTVAEPPLPILDAQAKAEYRRQLQQLDRELDESKAWNDEGRVEKLQQEREALMSEILSGTKPGGGAKTTGGQVERARVNVRKRITAAINAIRDYDPSLAHHLESTVRTGLYCRYEPDPLQPPTWQL